VNGTLGILERNEERGSLGFAASLGLPLPACVVTVGRLHLDTYRAISRCYNEILYYS